jgi:UDP-N-acetylmuramoyl-tripeptide--D-alanyl-D-alanine ligase
MFLLLETPFARRVYLGLVRLHRRRLRDVVFIGVTGSTGKTTAKDLIAEVLSSRFDGLKNPSSWNTLRTLRSALPRVILSTRNRHRYCVLEMGTHRPGAMDELASVVQPSIGVLTNVRTDHWRAFGSAEAIAAEKGRLVAALPADGTAIVNADDPLVLEISSTFEGRVITYGFAEHAEVRAEDARCIWPERLGFSVVHEGRSLRVETRLCGTHWVPTVLAALSVGLAMGVPLEAAIAAIGRVEPAEARMEPVVHPDGVVFIRDDDKAPFYTVAPALDFMRSARAPRKIAILGTLSDYTGTSRAKYESVARQARESVDYVFFVGRWSYRCLVAKRHPLDDSVRAFGTVKQASDFLLEFLKPGDLVLLKGSNNADHLARILLARTARVECWRESCGKKLHCNECWRLEVEPREVRSRDIDESEPFRSLPLPSGEGRGPCQVVVGIGNPGRRYDSTPHNVGHRVLDSLGRAVGGEWASYGRVEVLVGEWKGQSVYLVKPKVPVNWTGPLVARLAEHLGSAGDDFILVHDEIDLPFARVRIRMRGGDGGHRGVRSILDALQSLEVRRVKIGVGRPETKKKVVEHVLHKFTPSEDAEIELASEEAVTRVLGLLESKR